MAKSPKAGATEIARRAYDCTSDDRTYIKRLTESVYQWWGTTMGIIAYDFTIENGDVHLGKQVIGVDAPDHWLALPQLFLQVQNLEERLRTHSLTFGLAQEIFAPDFWQRSAPPNIPDGYSVQSRTIDGDIVRGIQIFAASETPLTPTANKRRLAEMLCAHVGAGIRLRHELRAKDPLSDAAAIFESDGRTAHLREGLGDEVPLTTLQQYAKAAERGRGAMDDGESYSAMNAWSALMDGQWSIIEHFDSDGRRYMVAIENPPNVIDPRALSKVERMVVAYAALGYANKSIAYNLGIHEASVSKAIARALDKLGLVQRTDIPRTLGPLAKSAHESGNLP